jgi:hypothetical protein
MAFPHDQIVMMGEAELRYDGRDTATPLSMAMSAPPSMRIWAFRVA